MPARQRFRVELKDGDTTVVSWKKLVTDVEGRLGAGGAPSDAPAGANPALEARIAPEVTDIVLPPVLFLLPTPLSPSAYCLSS